MRYLTSAFLTILISSSLVACGEDPVEEPLGRSGLDGGISHRVAIRSPNPGETLADSSAIITGWCEYGSKLYIQYVNEGRQFSPSSERANPRMVKCEACDAEPDCGTGVNDRGQFTLTLRFSDRAVDRKRSVRITQIDRAGNKKAEPVVYTVFFEPPLQETSAFPPIAGAQDVRDMGIGVGVWEDPQTGETIAAVGATVAANDARQDTVLIYRQQPSSNWTQLQQLTVNGDPGDRFGASLSITKDLLLVGAPFEDGGAEGTGNPNAPRDNDVHEAGAVYVFERQGGTWVLIQYLKPKAGSITQLARFGWSLDLDPGGLLVVGAPFQNFPNKNTAGAAYAFRRGADGLFRQVGFPIIPSVPRQLNDTRPFAHEEFDQFGYSVATDGQVILVGAPEEDSGDHNEPMNNDDQTKNSGAAYLFRLDESHVRWFLTDYFKPVAINMDARFGWSLDMWGSWIAIGAPFDNLPDERNAGSVTLISQDPLGNWIHRGTLRAPDTQTSGLGIGDLFGFSTTINETNLVVTAPLEDGNGSDPADNSVDQSGAGYLYTLEGSTWTLRDYLKADSPIVDHQFGGYLMQFKQGDKASVHGGTILIGAPGREEHPRGSVHAFK
jgi:hypothetical protein